MIVAPVDERVERLAVRPDGRAAERAVLPAVDLRGLHGRGRAARRRLTPRRLDVRHRERDVVDAVTVLAEVLGDLAIRRERCREHEPDPVLDHDVARAVAHLRLEAAERDRGEAPQRPVVGGRLAGVPDPEFDVVDAVDRQEVGGLGVRVGVNAGAGLVGGPAGDRLGHGASPLQAGPAPRRSSCSTVTAAGR